MSIALTIYILMWPVIVLGVLLAIAIGFIKDLRKAHKEGRRVI